MGVGDFPAPALMTRYCNPEPVVFTPSFLALSARNFVLPSGDMSVWVAAPEPGVAVVVVLLACCWLHPTSARLPTHMAATAMRTLARMATSNAFVGAFLAAK